MQADFQQRHMMNGLGKILAGLAILTLMGLLVGAGSCLMMNAGLVWVYVTSPEFGAFSYAAPYVGLALVCMAVGYGCLFLMRELWRLHFSGDRQKRRRQADD